MVPRRDFNDELTYGQQGLPGRLTAPQSINFQSAREWLEFAADEAMRPVAGGSGSLLEQCDGAETIGATQENNTATGKIAWGDRRARQAGRCCLDTFKMAEPVGRDETVGLVAYLGEPNKMMTPPDLCLPKMIEAFDFGLEAGLPRGREDRDHAETKAEVNDSPEFAGGGVRALKAGVIVELDVAGSAVLLPMQRKD